MQQTRTNLYETLRRPTYFLAALGLLISFSSGIVSAAAVGGQVQYRSIRMSDDGVSGGAITSGVGSGAAVTYRVTFRAATSYTIKGVILDFCKGSGGTPFIGDSTCPAPTAFTVGGSPTVDTSNYTDASGTTTGLSGTWTAASLSSGQTLKITNSTGASLSSGTDYTFAVSGVTNPSDLGTFYARLITYTSDSGSIASYAHGTPGTYQDYGGFALSTANIVQVTAKVQETLTFCVVGSTTAFPTLTSPTSCSDGAATAPAISLGHGTNNTLDTTAVDTNGVFTIVSTNALNGITIRMHDSNGTCGGLSTDNGTTCAIPPTNGGAATTPTTSGEALTAGTAAFGVAVSSGGGVTASAPYTGSTASSYYGMDATTSGANVTTTYGSKVLASTGPINNVSNAWSFAATASNTTPAGIYSARLALIATGSF